MAPIGDWAGIMARAVGEDLSQGLWRVEVPVKSFNVELMHGVDYTLKGDGLHMVTEHLRSSTDMHRMLGNIRAMLRGGQ